MLYRDPKNLVYLFQQPQGWNQAIFRPQQFEGFCGVVIAFASFLFTCRLLDHGSLMVSQVAGLSGGPDVQALTGARGRSPQRGRLPLHRRAEKDTSRFGVMIFARNISEVVTLDGSGFPGAEEELHALLALESQG